MKINKVKQSELNPVPFVSLLRLRLNQVVEEVEAEVRVAVEVTEVEEVTGEEEVIAVDVVMQGGGEVEAMKIEEVVE